MLNKVLLLFSFVILCYLGSAQGNYLYCGSGRYIEDVFPDYTKITGITFGFNTTTDYDSNVSTNHELKLDYYEPTSDGIEKRPLILLMFGGGFLEGNRTTLNGISLAFARKGYTVATIDYRLVTNNTTNFSMVYSSAALLADELVKAASDLKAAIRFFKRDAVTSNIYRIDTSKIFVGGLSAGAIAALHAAYIDDINEDPAFTAAFNNNGGIEGNTDLPAPDNLLPHFTSKGIAAVFNLAGCLADTSIIDANDPPMYSSHGSADDIVPFNFGSIKYKGYTTAINFFGGNSMKTRDNSMKLKNELLIIDGGNHASPAVDPYIRQNINKGAAFMASIICAENVVLPLTLTSFTIKSESCAAVLHWTAITEHYSSYYDVEASADGLRFTKIASMPCKNTAGGSEYFYTADNFPDMVMYRLKIIDKDGRVTYSTVQRFNSACGSAINLYPNPARAFTTISGLKAGMQVQVKNAEGKLLFTRKSAGGILQIPLSTFAKGLLLVHVVDDKGTLISSSKLLKN